MDFCFSGWKDMQHPMKNYPASQWKTEFQLGFLIHGFRSDVPVFSLLMKFSTLLSLVDKLIGFLANSISILQKVRIILHVTSK
jgi:hypothetical protein